MIVDVYVPNQLLEKRLVRLFKEFELVENVFFHKSIDLLLTSLLNVRRIPIVILDTTNVNVLEYVHKLKNSVDQINFISTGNCIDIPQFMNLLRIGFLSHLEIDTDILDFSIALKRATKGERYISNQQYADIVNWFLNNHDFENRSYVIENNSLINSQKSNIVKVTSYLTDKEKSVCEFLLKGLSYKEISNILGTSSYTVNQRVRSIYRKLQVKSRSELSYKFLA